MSLSITNSFIAHTIIKAEDHNQNFQDIETWANNLGIQNIWSPVVYGATSAGSGSYSRQSGMYFIVGNLCFIFIHLNWSTHSGTGAMRITVPFPIITTGTTMAIALNVAYANFDLNANVVQVNAYITQASGDIVVQEVLDNASGSQVSLTNNQSGREIIMFGMYPIA